MKHVIITAIAVLCTLASCKKQDALTTPKHETAAYRVLAIGKSGTDTSISTSMFARAETVGLVTAEDAKLKAVLIAYNGNGVYTVQVTNKQNCQSIIRWGWEGLTIDDINPTNDVIPANSTITFTLTGDAKEGRIKLKAEGECGNSSTLIINITANILPINYLANTAKYDAKTGSVIVSFTIDDPKIVDYFKIQRYSNTANDWIDAMLFDCDHVTTSYSVKL